MGVGVNLNLDPIEAKEWLDSFDAVTRFNGSNVSSEPIQRLTDHAREQGVKLPAAITTPFKNTINPKMNASCPVTCLWSDVFVAYSLERDGHGQRANDNEDGWAGISPASVRARRCTTWE